MTTKERSNDVLASLASCQTGLCVVRIEKYILSAHDIQKKSATWMIFWTDPTGSPTPVLLASETRHGLLRVHPVLTLTEPRDWHDATLTL